MATKGAAAVKQAANGGKKSYVKQADIPRLGLSEAIRIAKALLDNFAGKSAAPHQLAMAVDMSPTSSAWRELTGSALAYGLTDGSWSATNISLTDLGRRIVAPTEEGMDASAKIEAVLRPSIAQKFFQKYDRAKFPQDIIAKNVLLEMGVPSDRLTKTLELLKENGELVGLIQQTKTGPFVAIEKPRTEPLPAIEQQEQQDVSGGIPITPITPAATIPPSPVVASTTQRVFIAHGKNKEVVTQLKDLLAFGKFVPVIAEEHETIAKPLPDKVMDEMRSCFAGVIHVATEEELLDSGGSVHHKLNENVLIEIGASLALFGRKLVLLVQKGIHLPSNLQGLYVCFYEGDKLDYEATMKLLKAFSEFR